MPDGSPNVVSDALEMRVIAVAGTVAGTVAGAVDVVADMFEM
jgi:hypothetical protein